MTPKGRSLVGLTMAALTALSLVGCTPGSGTKPAPSADTNSSVQTDVSKMGDVTLTVWDQEVRGGQDEQMKQLNQAFQDKYPNITIKRVSQSFDDLGKTLRLALSGDDAPDVVEANNARNSMGAFVAAGQLRNLNPWAAAYKWADRYPESILKYSRYSTDGKNFGTGSIFGLPQVGEVVGVFYSKKKLAKLGIQVPTDWAAFEAALETAKNAGTTPLLLGNIEKWPAIHVFGPIQGALVPSDQIEKLGFGNAGASWTSGENVQAAQTLSTWAKDGYFNKGVNGTDYDAAWQKLTKGDGAFLLGGVMARSRLARRDGRRRRILHICREVRKKTLTHTGGTGLPFTVTNASKHADAAAAYIDFVTNDDAMANPAKTGNLPVVDTQNTPREAGGRTTCIPRSDG